MFELQKDFIIGFLMKYLHRVHMPFGMIEKKTAQSNDLPNKLMIFANKKEALEFKRKNKNIQIFK